MALAVATGGISAAVPATAAPIAAGTVNAGSFTVGGGGTVEDPGPAATTNTIRTTAARTILNFSSFDLDAVDELRIEVGSRSDIVLIRVASGSAQLDGRLLATTGPAAFADPADPSSVTNAGGNVWISAGPGVVFGATAQVDVGGLLALTGSVTDADLLDADLAFTLSGSASTFAGVTVHGDMTAAAAIRGHGSLVGLVGRYVQTLHSTDIGAAPGSRSELLVGSVRNAALRLAARPDGGLDLVSFEPSGSNPAIGVAAAGTLTAADVFVSSTATTTSTDTASAYITKVNANGHLADGDGDLVVSAGGGLTRSATSDRVRPVLDAGAPAQIVMTKGRARANGNIVVAGSGQVDLGYGTDLGAPTVSVAARGPLRNFQGDSAIDAASTSQWVLYASQPSDVVHPNATSTNTSVNGTLDSQRTAVWGGTLPTHPPSTLTGNRYVFSNPPDITVEADDKAKDYDDAFAAGQATELTATITGALHPGVPGLFAGDTGTLYTGAPSLVSEGAPHTAPERPGGYPIVPSIGSLTSPVGHEFVFVDGRLDVDDTSPPTVTPGATGTLGSNGWYTGDAGLTWSIVDPGTVSTSITGTGCGARTFTSDQPKTGYTCTGTSLGGSAAPVTVTIGRDATRPALTAASSIGGVAHPAGVWTAQDVRVDFTCSDETSGVAPGSPTPDVDPVTTTQTLNGTCTDNAGNTSTVSHQVNIDRERPTVTAETLRISGTTTAYVPGTWTNRDVELTWQCTDTGGSGVVEGARSATTTSSATLQGLCRDGAGNEGSGSPFDVLVERVPPTIVEPVLTSGGTSYAPGDPAPGPVTLTWSCADEGGSLPTRTSGEQTATTSGTLTATCTDNAGNSVTRDFAVTIDDQAPTIGDVRLTTADGVAYTSGTWTDQAVTLSWTCTDGQSGATTVADSLTATATGPLRATCTDLAGNGVQGELFQANIDTLDPVLDAMPASQSLTTTGDTATATWTTPTATDDQDTAVAVACDPPSGSSFPVGTTTVTCTATDHAGNTASGTFTVTVTRTSVPVTRIRLRAPIDAGPTLNTAVHTRTVPVRVSLVRPPGSAAAPLYAATPQPVACTVTRRADAVEFYTTRPAQASNLFVWDPVKRSWLYRLDPRMLGLTTGTCYRVAVMHGGTVERRMADGGSEVGFFYLRTS